MEAYKQLAVSETLHRKLKLIKFYAGLDCKIVASEILSEALTSEILQKVLMRHLENKAQVDNVLKHLKDG